MLLFIRIILRHKTAVILVTSAAFVVSAAVSLILPPRYQSYAAFMPIGVEKELTGQGGFFSNLGSFGEAYAALMRVKRNAVLEFILRSRRMSDLMSSRFSLDEVYGTDDPERIRKRLRMRTRIEVWDEGVLTISTEDRDPLRAKRMVEAYISNLDSLILEMSVADATDKSRFLMEELERRKARIARLDTIMMDYMEQHGIYEIEQQVRAALEVAAAVTARIRMLEVERQLMEMTLKEGSLELGMLDTELEKLQQQLLAFKEGGEGRSTLFPPLDELPDLASEYLRLFSERKIQEFAVTFINLKLQDAQILENSRMSVIRVIDPPAVPDKRLWPKRKQIVMSSTLVAFFWMCLILMARDRYREQLQDPAGRREVSSGSGRERETGEGGDGE